MGATHAVRPGVYFTAVQGEGVVMDLVEDRYYGLGAESATIWEALESGDGAERIARELSIATVKEANDLVAEQLRAWEQGQLLVPRSLQPGDPGMPVLKSRGLPATQELNVENVARVSWRMLVRFLTAVWWSRRRMERVGICRTLREVQEIRAPLERMSPEELPLERMVHAYRSLRRLASQGKDDCLPRSLSLTVALRRLGIDAELCFGVQKFPFLAHAWVEVAGVAVNERPTRLQTLTVIARF